MRSRGRRARAIVRYVRGSRAGQLARRGGAAALAAAKDERHTFAAVIAGGVAGYAEREDMLDRIPDPLGIGPIGTAGAAAWFAGRYMKSRTLRHVATGLLSIAAYKKMSEPTSGT
jgi:hypothetical protein